MKLEVGNIWEKHEKGYFICVTTNGFIKKDGTSPMGRGIALQAAIRYPELPERLGAYLSEYGNHVFPFRDLKIFTFPTKRVHFEMSNIELIATSCRELQQVAAKYTADTIYLPKPGCQNGGLNWQDVLPLLNENLKEEQFAIMDLR